MITTSHPRFLCVDHQGAIDVHTADGWVRATDLPAPFVQAVDLLRTSESLPAPDNFFYYNL